MMRRYSGPRTFSRLRQPLAAPGQVRRRLHHRAFTSGRSEFFPPRRPFGDRSRVRGVDEQSPSRSDQLRGRCDEPVGDVEVERVWPLLVCRVLGGQHLERCEPHTGESFGGPAVAPVRSGERLGVVDTGPRPFQEGSHVHPAGGRLLQS